MRWEFRWKRFNESDDEKGATQRIARNARRRSAGYAAHGDAAQRVVRMGPLETQVVFYFVLSVLCLLWVSTVQHLTRHRVVYHYWSLSLPYRLPFFLPLCFPTVALILSSLSPLISRTALTTHPHPTSTLTTSYSLITWTLIDLYKIIRCAEHSAHSSSHLFSSVFWNMVLCFSSTRFTQCWKQWYHIHRYLLFFLFFSFTSSSHPSSLSHLYRIIILLILFPFPSSSSSLSSCL